MVDADDAKIPGVNTEDLNYVSEGSLVNSAETKYAAFSSPE
jgi:hypothetical protein